MPTCQHCGKEWKWKQTLKKMFTMDSGMKCPYCHEKQYMKTKTKRRNKLSLIVVPIIILLSILFNIPVSLTFYLLIGILILIIGFYPFLIELSNVEESIW